MTWIASRRDGALYLLYIHRDIGQINLRMPLISFSVMLGTDCHCLLCNARTQMYKQELGNPNMYNSSPPRLFFPSCFFLLALQFILRDPKSHFQHIQLLFHMCSLQARRYTGARVAACIHNVLPIMVLRLVQQSLDAWLREAPRTRIQRLLLRPNNGLGIWVLIEILAELGPGERVELLYACDGSAVELRM